MQVKFIERRKEKKGKPRNMRWNLRKKSENVSENKNSDKLTNERKVPSAVVFSVARARNFRTFNLLI